MSDVASQIMTDYPQFAFLLNDPEIGPLLLEAVDPNIGFDAATFQAKLMATSWWKTHSAAQRQWETLINTDPATANRQREDRIGAVRQLAAQLGLNLPDAQLQQFAESSLQYGVDPGSPTMRTWLANLASQSPAFTQVADVPLRQMAESDYMIPMSDADLTRWASQIAAGTATQDTFRATLQTLAKGRFSGYANLIDQGITPGQIFGPYRSAIAQQLEVSPDTIDLLNDPRWSKVTGVVGSDNTVRPMTMSEAITLARSQPEWSKTSVARQQGADLTQNLLKTFGAIG